jgi:hypothetical protein
MSSVLGLKVTPEHRDALPFTEPPQRSITLSIIRRFTGR